MSSKPDIGVSAATSDLVAKSWVGPLRWILLVVGVPVVCFWEPLFELFKLSQRDPLYSHIPLIPFIIGYVLWIERARFPHRRETSFVLSTIALASSVGVIALCAVAHRLSYTIEIKECLSSMILGFNLLLLACFLAIYGAGALARLGFPAGLLIFLIPLPFWMENLFESFLQYASATAAHWGLMFLNIPVLRDGLNFQLPGLNLHVAAECSGIRSSLVLLITSLLAGHLFLRNLASKTLLVFVVVPLGVMRNAFRITTLAYLSIYVDEDIIHSPLHHSGGPLFFGISLVPFILLLIWLKRRETNPLQNRS